MKHLQIHLGLSKMNLPSCFQLHPAQVDSDFFSLKKGTYKKELLNVFRKCSSTSFNGWSAVADYVQQRPAEVFKLFTTNDWILRNSWWFGDIFGNQNSLLENDDAVHFGDFWRASPSCRSSGFYLATPICVRIQGFMKLVWWIVIQYCW